MVLLAVQALVLYLIDRQVENAENLRMQELFEKRVSPRLEGALRRMEPAAHRMYQAGKCPRCWEEEQPVYANVTIQMTYRGSESGIGHMKRATLEDMTLVGVTLGRRPVNNRRVVSRREEGTVFQTSFFTEKLEVTYAEELLFPGSAKERRLLELSERLKHAPGCPRGHHR